MSGNNRSYLVRLSEDEVRGRIAARRRGPGRAVPSEVRPIDGGVEIVEATGKATVGVALEPVDTDTTRVTIHRGGLPVRAIVGVVVASLSFAAILRIAPATMGVVLFLLALVGTIVALRISLRRLSAVTSARHQLHRDVESALSPFRVSAGDARRALPFRG